MITNKKGQTSKHPFLHRNAATIWLLALCTNYKECTQRAYDMTLYVYLGWFQYSVFHKVISTLCQAVLDAEIANPSLKLSFRLEKFYDDWFCEGQFHMISQLCCALTLGRAPKTTRCVHKTPGWIVVRIFSGCHNIFEGKNGSISQNVVLGVHRTNCMRSGNENRES